MTANGAPRSILAVSKAPSPTVTPWSTALTAGVVVSLDNRDELDDVFRLAEAPAAVALRMAAADPRIPDSRFGQTADAWVAAWAKHKARLNERVKEIA